MTRDIETFDLSPVARIDKKCHELIEEASRLGISLTFVQKAVSDYGEIFVKQGRLKPGDPAEE